MYKLLLITGGTGSGKTKLAKTLTLNGYGEVISHTDKSPRVTDVDGKDYYFTNTEFMLSNTEFIEHITFGGYHYGITKNELMSKFEEFGKAVAVVGVVGLKQILTWLLENPEFSKNVDVIQLHLDIPKEVRFNRLLKESNLNSVDTELNLGVDVDNYAYRTAMKRIQRDDDTLDVDMDMFSKDIRFFNSVSETTNSLQQIRISMLNMHKTILKNRKDYHKDNFDGVLELLCPYLDIYLVDLVKDENLTINVRAFTPIKKTCKVIIGVNVKELKQLSTFLDKYNIAWMERVNELLIDFNNLDYEFVCSKEPLKEYIKGRGSNTYFIYLTQYSDAKNAVNNNNGSYYIDIAGCLVGTGVAKDEFERILHEIDNKHKSK